MHRLVFLLPVLLLNLVTVALAANRCDCSEQAGPCNASVAHLEGLVEVTTDTRACAQVLYYVDGQPFVRVVTDGRDARAHKLESFQALQAGECRVCREREISEMEQVDVNLQCEADLLMPTDATRECESRCAGLEEGKARERCEYNCQRHSRCLDKPCVDALRSQLVSCEKRCDRELQSSMAIDMDAFEVCQRKCDAIKQEIQSCPVL